MKDKLDPWLSHKHRFLLGISLIIPWMFLNHSLIKTLLFLFLAFMTRLSGKKLKWAYFLLLITSISFFHLLTPMGRALFTLWGFPITLGALETGYLKGITLIGLVFISLSSVKPGLRFPGAFGGMLANTLFYFEEIMRSRQSLKPGKIIPLLDQAMMNLDDVEKDESAYTIKSSPKAILAGLLLNLLFYSLWISQYFHFL